MTASVQNFTINFVETIPYRIILFFCLFAFVNF